MKGVKTIVALITTLFILGGTFVETYAATGSTAPANNAVQQKKATKVKKPLKKAVKKTNKSTKAAKPIKKAAKKKAPIKQTTKPVISSGAMAPKR